MQNVLSLLYWADKNKPKVKENLFPQNLSGGKQQTSGAQGSDRKYILEHEENGAVVEVLVKVIQCKQLEKDNPDVVLDSFRLLENRINLEVESFFFSVQNYNFFRSNPQS